MGLAKIVQCLVAANGVVFFLALLTPLRRWRGWRLAGLAAGLLALGTLAGILQAHAILDGWIEAKYRDLAASPNDPVAFRYLAGDFIPAQKLIGGKLKPHIRELLRDMAKKDSPCESAMARAALGEKIDVSAVCR